MLSIVQDTVKQINIGRGTKRVERWRPVCPKLKFETLRSPKERFYSTVTRPRSAALENPQLVRYTRQFGKQHKSHLQTVAMYVERTVCAVLYVLCDRELSADCVSQSLDWHYSLNSRECGRPVVSSELVALAAAQKQPPQILFRSKTSCFHVPIFQLDLFQQHKVGNWKVEWL